MDTHAIPTGTAMDFDEAFALEAERPGTLFEQYWRDGYLIINGVISPEEADEGRRVMDEAITPDSPETFAHLWGTRRQLKCPDNSIPALGKYACHPRMLRLVDALIKGEYLLTREPIAVATFPGVVCGSLAEGNWIGHTDGLPDGTGKNAPGKQAPVWLSFRDIKPGGGAMTMLPGSHRWIADAVSDLDFVAAKKAQNEYRVDNAPDGLDWNPVELCVRAGGVFVYNGHTIHSASNNNSDAPRQVCLYVYARPDSDHKPAEHFDAGHVRVMSPELRRLAGFDGR